MVICGGAGGAGFEQLFFAIDHGIDVVGGELETMAVGDRVGGAGFDTVTTEDAARIVNIVNAGVAFAGGDAFGFGIFGGFDIDATRRASRGAEEAGDTFFEAVFIAVENMNPAVTRLKVHGLIGIIFGGGLSPKIAKGDAEALGQRSDRAADFFEDRSHFLHVPPIRPTSSVYHSFHSRQWSRAGVVTRVISPHSRSPGRLF